jgi:glycosyltransferase involved in cell wall biosynthesis
MPAVKLDDESSVRKWRSRLDIPEDCRIVGSITRFDAVKGTGYLIRAFAELLTTFPTVVLVLFADGPNRSRLEALAKDLGVWDRIRFAGFQPDARMHLSAMDCFVLSSLNEGLPFALLEALAAGTPAVVSSVGGVPDVLRNEEHALLVPPGNPAAIARAIRRILSDESLAQRIGHNGKAIGSTLGIDRHVEKLTEVYKKAIATRGALAAEARPTCILSSKD